ncbi:radical SAM protein [Lyngbya sp. CCY1209]|uniref:B12-binding domain-containing radical SAM protein n=1 Tax=Lyngbya sp. CCY1209 TaxID=2886103 RepID=UPI002D2075B8|nr:radical SAM protein [Lyngbya sp. CCY1209]MEB3885969.1 radical SAM protein [Lyngbya sp. CCY1209]
MQTLTETPSTATEKQTVLLLNPPGDKKYFRDYYCTKVSKAHYYYHPVDLVYLSGTLSEAFPVAVIDAIAESLTEEECRRRVEAIAPDVILFLISSPSYNLDVPFITQLKQTLPETRFIGTGDIYREFQDEALEMHPFLDAILLDFSTDDIITYLQNGTGEVINNIIYRHGGEIVAGEEIHGNGNFRIPTPRWDLFPIDSYRFPFERRGKFASILTDFGCAYSCTFCPISTLGFKLRPVADVVAEIELLKSLGVRELFFRDQTFGVNKKRTLELCEALKPLNMSWTCFTRVDVLNEAIAKPMKEAGCHTIMFGIESADEELLKKYEKNTQQNQMLEAIALCKKYAIETVGTFILGLPGDTRESTFKTLEFAKKLDLDFASFNIAVPRFGTAFRKDALANGWASEEELVFESSASKPIWQNQTLSNEEIFEIHQQVKRGFYLRPAYLLKRIFGIRTPHQFLNSLEGFYFLLFKK